MEKPQQSDILLQLIPLTHVKLTDNHWEHCEY